MKRIIGKTKYLLTDLLVKSKFKKSIESKLKYKLYSTKYKHTFFGYYDKTPFSADKKKILAITSNHDTGLTKPVEAIVGYFDIKSQEFTQIDKTTTWCWQQACRLMWFSDNSVIYNKMIDGKYGSTVYDIEQKKVIKQYNFPIYDKTSDNKYALSLNFSRLQYFRPGYGYNGELKEEEKTKILKTDGIYLCNFEDNSQKILISLSDIIKIDTDETFDDAYHYINHLKFAQDDQSFIFYHIWNKGSNRYTRAIIANTDGKIIKVLNNGSFMSHYSFKNSNELLIYTKMGNKEGYYLYDLKKDQVKIFLDNLNEDGHPNFISDKDILTDTYPDRLFKQQKLILATPNDYKIIAKIYSPSNYQKEFRCDLHPRISDDNKLISIDIPTFEGRKLMVLENE